MPSLGCSAAQWKPAWVQPLGDEHPVVTVPQPCREVPSTPSGGAAHSPQDLKGWSAAQPNSRGARGKTSSAKTAIHVSRRWRNITILWLVFITGSFK